MSPTAQMYDFAAQILASQEFFHRSTSTLDESDSEFSPRDEMMTVTQQVAHTAHTLEWFLDGATKPEGFDLNFEEQAGTVARVTSLTIARQKLDAAFARAAEFLRSQKPEQLAQPLQAGPIMGGQPVSDIVWAMVEHTAHHRGVLAVYARLLGKVPPMPYGG